MSLMEIKTRITVFYTCTRQNKKKQKHFKVDTASLSVACSCSSRPRAHENDQLASNHGFGES